MVQTIAAGAASSAFAQWPQLSPEERRELAASVARAARDAGGLALTR